MPEYKLPFPDYIESKASSPTGKCAHENFPESKYAMDFILPAGTPIMASRSGRVTLTKYDSHKCISDINKIEKMTLEELMDFSKNYTNLVCVDHGDGTYAEYLHLDNEVFATEGREVKQGDVIGHCGMSGITTEPHLHFNVFEIKDGKAFSIPVKFR